MGVSYTIERSGWNDNQRIAILTAEFDSSYTAGGEPLDPTDANLGGIQNVLFEEPVSESGYFAAYRSDDGTIKMYETGGAGSTLQEVADATDLSTESVRLEVWGRS